MAQPRQIKAHGNLNRKEFIETCQAMSKEELEALAKSEGLPGRSSQSREELIEQLLHRIDEGGDETPPASNSGLARADNEPFKEKQHGAWKDLPGKHR